MILKVCSEDSGWQEAEGTWSPETSDCYDESGAGASQGPDRHRLNSFDLCSVQAQLSASVRQCYWSQEWSIDQGVCFSFCSLLTEMLMFLFVQVIHFEKIITKWPWLTTWLSAVQYCKKHTERVKKWEIITPLFYVASFYIKVQEKMDLEFSDVRKLWWKEKYHLLSSVSELCLCKFSTIENADCIHHLVNLLWRLKLLVNLSS